METRRWVNQSHPQTLQIAVLLFYLDAAFNVLFGAVFSPVGLVITVAEVYAGVQIAGEKRQGYRLGVALSVFVVAFVLVVFNSDILSLEGLMALLFPVARLALLLHEESRNYQRIWFH
jgi:hypothetical protein